MTELPPHGRDACDCADELERRLRVDNAADGQFPETSGWAALFGIGGDVKPAKQRPPGSCDCEDDEPEGPYFYGGCGKGLPGYDPDGGGPGGGGPGGGGPGGGGPGGGRSARGGRGPGRRRRGGPGDGDGGGGAYGTAKRRTASDVLIPIIGGGLVFLGLLGVLYRYFDAGNVLRSKLKSAIKQVLDLICDPKTSILPGIGIIGTGGKGIGRGRGGAGADATIDLCDETFHNRKQNRHRKKDSCGEKRIDPDKRKWPFPPTWFTFPVIPGLHECSDDEDYEEGVFQAPGPHGS